MKAPSVVAKARIDLVVTFGLERQQRAGLLPGDEILHGLKNGHVDFELLRRELVVDLAVEHVAEPARHRDSDPRITLGEVLRHALVGLDGTAGVKHKGFFIRGLGIELIGALAARPGAGQARRRNHADKSDNACPAHAFSPP